MLLAELSREDTEYLPFSIWLSELRTALRAVWRVGDVTGVLLKLSKEFLCSILEEDGKKFFLMTRLSIELEFDNLDSVCDKLLSEPNGLRELGPGLRF